MSIKTLFSVTAIVGVVMSLAYLLIPTTTLSLLGMPITDFSIYAARFFGGSTFGYSILTWLFRDIPVVKARKALVTGLLVSFLLASILSLVGLLSGQIQAIGWVSFIIFLLFTLAYGYFQFGSPDLLK